MESMTKTEAEQPSQAPISGGTWRNRRRVDLTGGRFGRLVVIGPGRTSSGDAGWVCRCDCGGSVVLDPYRLRSNRTKSCGCLRAEFLANPPRRITHGWKGTTTYKCWDSMKGRCRHRTRRDWMDYGGRGITYCERWASFENFLADMGPRPSDDHSLDRIDVNGNYEPRNCRWATSSEQANNRTDNVYMTAWGERKTMRQWADDPRCVVDYSTLSWRMRRWGDPIKAMTQPLREVRQWRTA